MLLILKLKSCIISALYNDTSLQYPEVNTDFTRLFPNILMFKHLSLPEHWNEISDRLLKKYFPYGKMDDHTHSNAVDVCTL